MGEYTGNGNNFRANPIKFAVSYDDPCNHGGKKPYITQGSSGGGLLGAMKRVSQIEALGKATRGVNLLVKTVEAGGPQVAKYINGGPNDILRDVTGASADAIQAVNRVSPDVVNKAVFSAEILHEKIKSGDLSIKDAPRVVGDFRNLIKLIGNIFNGGNEPPFQSVCAAPNYAMDLVNFGVKQNYRFIVRFEFNAPYIETLGSLSHTFGVKTCDRPSVTFEHEDVNMYNYRTKVAVRTMYNPITMTFYDDQWSHALEFFTMYLKFMSPISNMHAPEYFHEQGMEYAFESIIDSGTTGGYTDSGPYYSASLGPLTHNTGLAGANLIKKISIYHLYRGGGLMDEYTIMNPKVTDMELDQLNMEGGSTGIVTATFSYDAVNIQTFLLTEEQKDLIVQLSSTGGGTSHAAINELNPEKLVLPDNMIGKPGDRFEKEKKKKKDKDKSILDKIKAGARKVKKFTSEL